MKKLILGTALAITTLLADVSTVVPYVGFIDYDKNSTKDTASLVGVHYSKGNLSYLFEADFSFFNSKYKDSSTEDLNQNDFVISYSEYTTNYMSKLGYHYISTTDKGLGDGHIFNYTLGAYNWKGYDKYSLGLESYYSFYTDGHDENDKSKSVSIVQFTPYVGFYKAISLNSSNNLVIKLNYELALDYVDSDYISYELSDTFAYKKFFTTGNFYTGKSRTGVKDGGNTVFNSLDLMKTGYGLKVGYYIRPTTVFTLSYSKNNYEEYGGSSDISNNVTVASLSFTY